MEKTQKLILLAGIVMIVFMWIYPPWKYTYEGHFPTFTQWAGYYWVFSRPMHYGMRLDIPLLLVQCVGVIVVVCGLVFLLRKLDANTR